MTDTGIIRKLDALGRIVFLKSCATLSAGKPAQKCRFTLRGRKSLSQNMSHLAFSAVSLPRSTLRSIVFAPVAQLSA